MITRLTGLGGLAQRGASSLAALFILIGFAMSLEAQQYCVSGAITSILNCDGCNFSVGDPVAMTFTVPSGGVTCAAWGILRNRKSRILFRRKRLDHGICAPWVASPAE